VRWGTLAFFVSVALVAVAGPRTTPVTVTAIEEQITALRATIDEHDQRYEQRFQAQQAALAAALTSQKESVRDALAAADRAVTKSETATEKRFEGVNEFRGQLKDQSSTFITRTEHASDLKGLTERLGRLEQLQADSAGSARQTLWILGLLVAVSAVVVSYLAWKRPPMMSPDRRQ
jgi:hypothetical protein